MSVLTLKSYVAAKNNLSSFLWDSKIAKNHFVISSRSGEGNLTSSFWRAYIWAEECDWVFKCEGGIIYVDNVSLKSKQVWD